MDFDELGLHLHGSGKCVLEGVTGGFHSGNMAAVMGPSGAGKTTFMNVLCGKATYGTMSGTVRLNGKESSISEIRPVTGFVPQDDIVHEELTVREQIYYSAKLRNPARTSETRLNRIVDDVLHAMQLVWIQHSIVGSVEKRGISGGQRKRVNIGLELAACPIVLFLDEPTSGLDATTSLGIVGCLKNLTTLGMTITMSIHQPRYSLFTLFDDVLLLGVGGRTVFQGPSKAAVPYFQGMGFVMPPNENPADWLMDAISGMVPCAAISKFQAEMLFELWNERKGSVVQSSSDQSILSRRLRRTSTRSFMIQQAIEDSWLTLNTDRNGTISRDEFRQLLLQCNCFADSIPKEVEDELLSRMGVQGSKAISKAQFVEFFSKIDTSFAGQGEDDSGSDSGSSSPDAATSSDNEARSLSCSSIGSIDMSRPGFCSQYFTLVCRNMIRFSRRMNAKALSIALVIFAAVVFGNQCNGKANIDDYMMPLKVNLSHVALGLMVAITCLDVFGGDRPMFWRESASGMNVLAFFLARATLSALDVWLMSFTFTITWYLAAAPADSFWLYNRAFRLLSLNAAGYGFLVSTLVRPQSATLAVSVVMLILGGAIGEPQAIGESVAQGGLAAQVPKVSAFTWAAGWNYLRAVELAGGSGAVPAQAQSMYDGYETVLGGNALVVCPYVLLAMACVILCLAYVGLKFTHRDKQV